MHANISHVIARAGTAGLIVLAGLVAHGCREQKDTNYQKPSIPVRVKGLRKMTFRQEIRLKGSLESSLFALVPAQTRATIEAFLVDEGERVRKGDTLCRLDSEQLQRTVESRKQGLEVAKSDLAVSVAQFEQAQAELELQRKTLQRFSRLAKEEAVAGHRLDETIRNEKTAAAADRVAQANVELSRARVKQAETALQTAQSNRNDTTVKAPISGRISQRFHEHGEMVAVGESILRIDDPSLLDVSVFIPSRYYSEIIPGSTVMHITVSGRDLGEKPVTFRSPTIDPRMRTFEVKAKIENPPEGIVAGSLADIRIILEQHEGFGVNPGAILKRNGENIIFANNGGTARITPVQPGIRTDGFTEIIGIPGENMKVIVQGQQFVNDGDSVTAEE